MIERQIARRAGFDEALLQRGVQRFRNTALDKPGRRDNVTFADERDGLIGRNDFVRKHAMALPRVPALDFGGTSTRPLKCRDCCFVLCPDTDVSAGPALTA